MYKGRTKLLDNGIVNSLDINIFVHSDVENVKSKFRD